MPSPRAVGPLAAVICSLLVATWGAVRPLHATPANAYAVTDIGIYGLPFIPIALSDSGVAVGTSDFTTAATWKAGVLTPLTMPQLNTQAQARGVYGVAGGPLQVVGDAKTPAAQDGFLSTDGSTVTFGLNPGHAYAVNAAGQVAVGDGRAAIWASGITTYLSAPNDYGVAFDINASGQAAGNAAHPKASIHAAMWSNGVETALEPVSQSTAMALNDSGTVVGFMSSPNEPTPARWQGGTRTDLPMLSGAHGMARDINNAGDIVGDCDVPTGSHGVLWANGVLIDLNSRLETAGWKITNAVSINNQGWILCYGEFQGIGRSCLLKPAGGPPPTKPDLSGKWGAVKIKRSRTSITLTGKLTVQNGGQGAASASVVACYVSADQTYQAGVDPPLLNAAAPVTLNVPGLAPRAKQALSLPAITLSMTDYNNLKGKYLLARLDDGGALDETSESNNLLVSKKLK